MPPKRKRTEDTADANSTATRATRSSARIGKQAASEAVETASVTTASNADASEAPPPPKKTKASTKAAPAKSKTAKAAKSRAKNPAPTLPQAEAATKGSDEPAKTDRPNRELKAVAFDPSKPEPYSRAVAANIFGTYADPDDPSVIGPEGFEKLLGDAHVPMDGAMPLLLAWQLEAQEMAKFTKDEWMKGMDDLQISSLGALSLYLHDLHDLLILNKPPITRASSIAPSAAGKKSKAAVSPSEPYNRARYWSYADDPKKAFSSMYTFCFQLVKQEGSRNFDMETACALWSVLLVPRYPLMADVMQFVNESGSYKGVNKDMWNMTLEFCQSVDPDLGNYEADGAWPSMLDDFATWKKAKLDSQRSAADEAVNVEA